MADQIRVLIVDDIPETRDHLSKLLGFESDIEVVGAAASGREAIEMAARLTPDIVLMDINMPDMDGIAATERLSAEVPTAAVVMMSVQGEADYLRRSMLAGAREFLVKPFSSDELTASIRQVYTREREKLSRIAVQPDAAGARRPGAPGHTADREADEPGRVVAVFGRRAASGARRSRSTSRSPLRPSSASGPASWTRRSSSATSASCSTSTRRTSRSRTCSRSSSRATSVHRHVRHQPLRGHPRAARPAHPEMAELITPVVAKRMIEALRQTHDLVVVDCMSSFNDTTLAILDLADTVLTMLSLEITSIKNIRLFLEVAEQLGYPRTRSGSSSTAPIRRWASASPTWSTRSGGAWITRSSPTVEASCTPSTGACRSS